MEFSDNQKLFFSLIRSGLTESPQDLSVFNSQTEWDVLYEMALNQSLLSVTFNGIQFLPIEVKPKELILMQWFGYSNLWRKRFHKHLTLTMNLCNLYQEHGINVLILKGVSLSSLYPQPEFREFGDLDIYTFDKFNESNDVISKIGIGVDFDHAKHSVYNFHNLHVENHKYFVTNSTLIGAKINAFLSKEAMNSNKQGANVYYPNATFNILFLLRHAIHHLTTNEMTVKNVVDWGLFLQKEGHNVDWSRIQAILKELKLVKAFDLLTSMSEMILHNDFSKYHMDSIKDTLAIYTINNIMNKPKDEKKVLGIQRVFSKALRLLKSKWIYDEGIEPDAFWTEAVFGSLRDHVKSPKFFYK